ncbi:MAG: SDR family NAD(P)-dependent oxidoreductase [Myxococcales bacterium]|nr:SDR family NAD(P)-dependent oxidoreductase [Myxococcales bacterium]
MNRSFIIAAGGGRDNMPVADFGLEGRVAVVTGASRGIGEAIARGFAEHGATVVISSRKQESPEQVAAAIENAGGKAIPIACHGGKPEQMQALFDRVEEDRGSSTSWSTTRLPTPTSDLPSTRRTSCAATVSRPTSPGRRSTSHRTPPATPAAP